ncbi:hypothetical protein HY993_03320 [Candidatus Micrarchaeota archaeon]|nr:hypothetical protein [Candidatus Micrarchaeota archaeon]
MIQNVFVIGATGKVGSAAVKQILDKDVDPVKHDNPTRIAGVASSESYLFSPNGLGRQECLDFAEKKAGSNSGGRQYGDLLELLQVVSKAGIGVVFVDATALHDLKFHKAVSQAKGLGMVTANKLPLVDCSFAEFEELTHSPSSYGYRCSVMAGAESVSLLQDLRDVSDPIHSLSGCFSGTLGFICTQLSKERKLSEIVVEAKEKGYTEPHPRDDLNGMDVSRKLLILARTAGFNVSMGDVALSPFIPEKYFGEEDPRAFADSLKELDEEFLQRIRQAKESGLVLRYVAQLNVAGGKPSLSVSLKEVPKDGPLGSLNGTSNKITVISGAYPANSPYVVEAPGAGLEVTAQNIRRDLLAQLQGRKIL